ncbi:flagellar hook-length control protein FliK [Paenibacillus turicensis]|uniref:flagellar hook-length control protein FliK n=1 Tax=Paenibacillus turicensis TaxID=160487 RepID=UPI003D2BAF57
MNIGPLVRSMIGDSKQGESKSLELKTGQVVRGTVLSVSENGQEAVIQVQGVKLHATLETPLQQGQTTLLQVQQPNEDGTVVLKPMESLPQKMLSGNSLLQIMQSLGLEDTESNRELLNQMQATGVPLTKDNVTLLGQLLTNRPQQVPLAEWIQAAGIALGRGLPVTAQSVAGLHQAVFGPPLHELMSALEDGINQWLSQQAKGNGQATQQNNNLGTLVNQNNNTLAGANSSITNSQTSAPHSTLVEAANQSNQSKANELLQVGQGQTQAQAGASDPKTATAMLKLEQALGQLRQMLSSDSLFEPQEGQTAKQNQQSINLVGSKTQLPTSVLPQGMQGQDGLNINSESWVGRVLKLLGVEHEQQVHLSQNRSTVAASPQMASAATEVASKEQQAMLPHTGQGNQKNIEASTTNIANTANPSRLENATQGLNSERIAFVEKAIHQQPISDSVKGLLLQLADANELPAPLKEVIKQVVQQLTGQQLLLNTDRTTPFAQVTMFLPFFGPDGQQTAAVHIESRRGRKGELDPANCRLWFDLQMKALGQIMVDVQVADKKVLLKIFSEHDTAGEFLHARKAEIETALEATGYQLLSLKIEQLIPNETEDAVNRDLSMAMSYTPSEYKGVDYRV